MSCFCRKLLSRQYQDITESETAILKRTSAEAPHLFQARRKKSASGSAPRRKRIRDQSVQVTSSLSSNAIDLTRTYSSQNAAKIFGEGGNGLEIQQAAGSGGVFVKIFLVIDQSDQKIEIQQIFRRTCCYAFAQLHKKGTSVDPIVQEIENLLPLAQDIKQKVYNILRIGAKWVAILETFASILNRPPQQLTGLLCLLESASTWERASTKDHQSALTDLSKNTDIYEKIVQFSTKDHQSALTDLSKNTDIYEKIVQFTPLVNNILKQLLLDYSFVDETRRLTSQSKSLLGATPMPQFGQISLNPSAIPTRRALHTAAEIEPAWKAPSLAAVSESIPESSHIHSEDANILLVFLSILATSEKIPLDLLFRGATPRRRWNVYGEIEEVDAVPAGLAPELCSLLSDIPRLQNAFHELDLSSAVSKNSDQTYILDEDVASRIRKRLSAENYSFYNCQALIVAYRAVPWKYIEPATPNTKLFLPHLKYALQEFYDGSGYLPTSTRADLVLTLVEASRFPNMAWKRFAIDQAEIAARDLENWVIHSSIAQSRCLISRISGNMEQAISSLNDLGHGELSSATVDKMTHSTIGKTAIQRSLNCIQIDDVSDARKILEDWSPLGQSPSSMEIVVRFRRDMILGRVLRFRGEFEESLAHLKGPLETSKQRKDLIFDEDLCDITCDLADTLLELGDPNTAEEYLRAEIMRRDQNCGPPSSGGCRLELSLADALFAQRYYNEAEQLCLGVQRRPGLLKFEKLRVSVALAKIRHINAHYEEASRHWAEALVAVGKFPNENCATRIIVLSVCDILSHRRESSPDDSLLDQSRQHLRLLDEREKPGGFRCWIAGMRHWAEYLSRGNPVSSHL